MDYEAVRQGLEQAIPTTATSGWRWPRSATAAAWSGCPSDDRLHNHVGSQHAGALFSAGEAASGAAFVGAFAERMGEITPLARTAEISYLKLAKGPITATGRWARRRTRCSSASTPTARWSSRSRSS